MGRTAGRGPRETQELILRAAQTVVLRRGDRASLDDVAQAAGVSRGAIIYHFSSKGELWRALVRDSLARFRESVDANIEAEAMPGRLARAYIKACLDGDGMEAVGERLQLLSALALVPGVAELVAEDWSRWKADLAADGLTTGVRAVLLSAIDGTGLVVAWAEKPDAAELAALSAELHRLTRA
jgi:AcrR family transcriptional regulator